MKKILSAVVLAALLMWSLMKGTTGEDLPEPAATAPASGQSSAEADVEVYPDLVGKRYQSEIKNSDLYAGYRIVMTEEYSSTVPSGCVISQSPVAGTLQTEENPILQIVVSKGPMLVEMPDIIGFTQENAAKQLDSAGIQYRMEIMENDGQYAEYCVAKCDVITGTKFDAGKTVVTVYIAGTRANTSAADEDSADSAGMDSATSEPDASGAE